MDKYDKFFKTLCQENYEQIFKYIMVMVYNKSVAEDIVQEVFIVAYEKRKTLFLYENKKAFLYKVSKNLTNEYIRKSKKYKIVELNHNNVVNENKIRKYLMLHYRELITYKCKDKGPILNSLLNEEENMDLREKINEAIENEDFETADTLTQKLYEPKFKDQNIHYSDDFAKKIILSKGKKNNMNNKFRKLAAASCALIVGVTGISVNVATDGEALNNVRTFIKNIVGPNRS